MGVTMRLVGLAARRPRVLMAAMPGATECRLALEAGLRRRGWAAVPSPAAADVVAACGQVPPDLAGPLAQVWSEVPEPKAYIVCADPPSVEADLDRVAGRLADPAGGPGPGWAASQPEYACSQDDGMGMGVHGGSGHGVDGDGGMEMPAGLAMADRGADRDGLKLDQLHAGLGPFLADWPAGLVLHLVMQGDIVQEATVETLGATPVGSFWNEPWRQAAAGGEVTAGMAARRLAACRLDGLGRLLAVAGWPDAAGAARWLRDELLAGLPTTDAARRFGRLERRVGRSRALQWATAGVGVIGGPDVAARYQGWLADIAEAVAALDDQTPLPGSALVRSLPVPAPGELLAALERAAVGAEIGAVRLMVAGVDVDLDEAVDPAGVGGG